MKRKGYVIAILILLLTSCHPVTQKYQWQAPPGAVLANLTPKGAEFTPLEPEKSTLLFWALDSTDQHPINVKEGNLFSKTALGSSEGNITITNIAGAVSTTIPVTIKKNSETEVQISDLKGNLIDFSKGTWGWEMKK